MSEPDWTLHVDTEARWTFSGRWPLALLGATDDDVRAWASRHAVDAAALGAEDAANDPTVAAALRTGAPHGSPAFSPAYRVACRTYARAVDVATGEILAHVRAVFAGLERDLGPSPASHADRTRVAIARAIAEDRWDDAFALSRVVEAN